MGIELASQAEEKAEEAENFRSFGGIKLLNIKHKVADLVGLIGRDGIFDEYTRHDITHVNEMLRILEWLIPADTWPYMSSADCLMTVLGIYFHDLGMLVTPHEFEHRDESDFPNFRDRNLFSDNEGTDYQEGIRDLKERDKERFLYQEFVRHNHAKRIRNWILGKPAKHLGVSHSATEAVSQLLEPLGHQFRKDLATVCASHHLNDLGKTDKYKVERAYGNSANETANLQYASVLLRTSDLLHITNDRTPSIEFRVISPSDPISQREWAKQMAVKRVKPKKGTNKEGALDDEAPKDTIEVFAYFTSEEGFFGLSSYLTYAENQLAKSHDWIEKTRQENRAPHNFPWRWIDDSNVETEGFLRKTFDFEIDQTRILDLLTGHTLYNDSRVVLRELVQNSLDAIRLQEEIDDSFANGRIEISWNSQNRELSVKDNGTGMTQSMITDYLLKVGSSRYQDPEFQKEYPDFSPISRFGIGVLSTFMISDMVQIVTCHPNDDKARQLSLRSVHGKYLIRLLDKSTHDIAAELAPHGTIFKLKIRHSADVPDMEATAREWVVVPGCEVTLEIDDQEPISVGHDSVGEALKSELYRHGYNVTESGLPAASEKSDRTVKVVERHSKGLDLAYALIWDPWFKEWAFLTTNEVNFERDAVIGTCVGGIRVERASPGYEREYVIALANAAGTEAPRTNVARYGLDNTSNLEVLLKKVYDLYCQHITQQITVLQDKREFSLTWATQEAQLLAAPLLENPEGRTCLRRPGLMQEAIREVPLLVVEENGERSARPISDLHSHRAFWTVDCALIRSVEWLLREFPGESSLRAVFDALGHKGIDLPKDPLLCGVAKLCAKAGVSELVLGGREVDRIVIRQSKRRADFRWVRARSDRRWKEVPIYLRRLYKRASRRRVYMRSDSGPPSLIIASHGVEVEKEDEVGAVKQATGKVLLLPDAGRAVSFLINLFAEVEAKKTTASAVRAFLTLELVWRLLHSKGNVNPSPEELTRWVEQEGSSLPDRIKLQESIVEFMDIEELQHIVQDTNWRLFDPAAWERRTE